MAGKYKNGLDFPNEGFVQVAIERYFDECGYIVQNLTNADLDTVHPSSKDRWIIEAKGDTKSNAGLDFKTGLGQLLTRMDDPDSKYAIAVPYTQKFCQLCGKVPKRVRELLNIYWLFVSESGEVYQCSPIETVQLPQ